VTGTNPVIRDVSLAAARGSNLDACIPYRRFLTWTTPEIAQLLPAMERLSQNLFLREALCNCRPMRLAESALACVARIATWI
jgi:hypothetical protein